MAIIHVASNDLEKYLNTDKVVFLTLVYTLIIHLKKLL